MNLFVYSAAGQYHLSLSSIAICNNLSALALSSPISNPSINMSSFFYGGHHQQHHGQNPHPMSQQHHGHGRSRRAPRLSASQNSHRQYRNKQPPKDISTIEPPSVTAFKARFEAGRSFDLDDDLEFCPHLLTFDDVNTPIQAPKKPLRVYIPVWEHFTDKFSVNPYIQPRRTDHLCPVDPLTLLHSNIKFSHNNKSHQLYPCPPQPPRHMHHLRAS